jgi:hypothetical protein
MSDDDAIERLPAAARRDLDQLARAIDRVPLQDLALYADRRSDEEHQRAVAEADRVAQEAGLTEGVLAAKHRLLDAVIATFGEVQMRGTFFGTDVAPPPGTDADRIRMLESLGDAVTASVLGDRLDPDVHAELLGLWARLLE